MVSVYCQFPGYIANGKVLLVGNMGLYDYRPYVKKVINNKQIMYDCDKGYVLENGPVSVSLSTELIFNKIFRFGVLVEANIELKFKRKSGNDYGFVSTRSFILF